MLRPGIAVLAALLSLLLTTAASGAQDEAAPPAIPPTPATTFSADQVIVQWAPGAGRRDKAEARAEADVGFSNNLGDPDFQLVTTEPGQTPAGAIAALEADPAVVLAERDGYRTPNAIPNDPLFEQLWGLSNSGTGIGGFSGAVAGDDVGAPAAWDRTVGSSSIVIADIDSGYRFEHPDLAGVAWDNPGETDNGTDDDGNGIVDDLHGADFIGANGESPAIDGDPTDDDLLSGGHGVHTAGTIGAAGNNGVGITGVAQDVRIMPLRVCSRFAAGPAGNRCRISAILNAINYAGSKGARVANMSLGGNSFTQSEVNAIAANADVLFVISAGNDGSDNDGGGAAPHGHHYPCDYQPTVDASPPVAGAVDNIVCIAATDQADGLAGFSDWGATSVDVGAPGTETLSTYPFVTPFQDSFTTDDFATNWPATGADGGFERSNEAPLTSFGMTDAAGAPVANTVRETTTPPFTVPANGGCKLTQTRRVVLASGDHFRYSVLLDGAEVAGAISEPASSAEPGLERRFLELPAAFKAGGSVQIRFRFSAGSAPNPGSGIWLDDISLVCAQAVGQASAYAFLQGTSMAAPHVSGAAGLLFSLEPAASVTAVREALLDGAEPVSSLAGKTVTGGRLDIPSAMDALEAGPVDDQAPEAPLLTSTDPASPASEGSPRILGSAEAGSTVDVYLGESCEGSPVASGTAAELAAPGIAVSAPEDSTSQFSATATDAALNTSPCSTPISYTRVSPPDSDAPAPPVLTTDPVSPSNDGFPRIRGTAEPGSNVEIFEGPTCSGSPLAEGTADELESPGFVVAVPASSTRQFSATATDAGANTSLCSEPISYTNSTKIIIIGPGVIVVNPLLEPLPTGTVPAAIVPQPVIPSCKVPKLAGKTLGQAKAALAGAGCRVGKVSKPRARKGQKAPALVVKSSSPSAGSNAPGAVVSLTLGPKPKKPHH